MTVIERTSRQFPPATDLAMPAAETAPGRVLRVLLVNDHALICETMSLALTCADLTLDTVGTVALAQARIADSGRFDVILLDYDVPGMDGLTGLRTLAQMNQGGVVLFSGIANRLVVERALDAGASGFIPKTLPLRTVRHAIRFIADGETFLPVEYIRRAGQNEGAELGLKPREIRVLTLLCEGLQNKEIGREMSVEETIVKLDVKSICRKLGARNRTQAVIEARNRGIC
jgi:two-component system, NarL family, nitrate/nitrite response regulator NarL